MRQRLEGFLGAKTQGERHLVSVVGGRLCRLCRLHSFPDLVVGRQLEVGDLAPLPVIEHPFGGGVEVRLSPPQQPPALLGQLRQEVLCVIPGLDLVRAALRCNTAARQRS